MEFLGRRFMDYKKHDPVAGPYRESKISERLVKNHEGALISFLSKNYRQPNLKIGDVE